MSTVYTTIPYPPQAREVKMTQGRARTAEPERPPAPSRMDRRYWRVFVFFSAVILLSLLGIFLMADFLWRTGWTTPKLTLLAVFSVLFGYIAFGCCHALFGFLQMRRKGGDPCKITKTPGWRAKSIKEAPTAIVVPIYNESVERVFAGLSSVYESLLNTGEIDSFDFFVLSDSTDTSTWIAEERAWLKLVQRHKAIGRIFYRRRLKNIGKKSGNISDFCRAWGQRYRYMIVLDADSVMTGETLTNMVKMMEASPRAGLIQTVPASINAETVFGRLQQFAGRLYGPIFMGGLNYWQRENGNYWGHNAIIRMAPFMEHCDLPSLPGQKPFGGQILSHDFVEAALLRKAGWEVYLAHDLEGSYEEGPPNLIESAKRDRRWCQGNLQHSMLLYARGFRGLSRIHLANGILGYLSSPLWLAFLILSTYIVYAHQESGLSRIAVASYSDLWDVDIVTHGLIIFLFTMALLFTPKICALIDLALKPERQPLFGGWWKGAASALFETVISTLIAPVMMLFHTQFVFSVLAGRSTQWAPQKRDADLGTSWAEAIQTHWVHTLLGVAWGVLAWNLDPLFFWWLSPVILGMALSVPVSVVTSRPLLGRRLRKWGLLLSPEETSPPPVISSLLTKTSRSTGKASTESIPEPLRGLRDVVLDPYANAVHVSLLRELKYLPHGELGTEEEVKGVSFEDLKIDAEALLIHGPSRMHEERLERLLCSADVLLWLHKEVWRRPAGKLSVWWQTRIRRYRDRS